MRKQRFTPLALTTLAAITLVACGGGEGGGSGPQAVAIDFAAVAGSTPVDCSTNLSDLGTTNATGAVQDLRFYIANVQLVRRDNTAVPLTLSRTDDYNATRGADTVTLIDLENKTGTCTGTPGTNNRIEGTVPAGDYVGVRMTLGVPLSMNHTDQSADLAVTPAVINNAVHPGMAWSWAGGRKFTRIEITNSTWAAPTFNVHVGSTACTGSNPSAGLVDACARPNRLDFGFASFNPSTQKIAVDLRALLSANDVTTNAGGPTGCMSSATDPECAPLFDALSLDLNTGLTVNSGLNQRLFKVVAK